MLLQRPEMCSDHCRAYATLFQQEGIEMGKEWVSRAMSCLIMVLSGTLFLSLTGVALMLGILLDQFHWILLLVPSAALLLFGYFVYTVTRPLNRTMFPQTCLQLRQDFEAICVSVKP
jgi:hypothetical protein